MRLNGLPADFAIQNLLLRFKIIDISANFIFYRAMNKKYKNKRSKSLKRLSSMQSEDFAIRNLLLRFKNYIPKIIENEPLIENTNGARVSNRWRRSHN